jgi:hypothetical protein
MKAIPLKDNNIVVYLFESEDYTYIDNIQNKIRPMIEEILNISDDKRLFSEVIEEIKDGLNSNGQTYALWIVVDKLKDDIICIATTQVCCDKNSDLCCMIRYFNAKKAYALYLRGEGLPILKAWARANYCIKLVTNAPYSINPKVYTRLTGLSPIDVFYGENL